MLRNRNFRVSLAGAAVVVLLSGPVLADSTGLETLYGVPWHLSKTPGSVRLPAPMLGQHNIPVLRDVLGYREEAIETMKAAGALG